MKIKRSGENVFEADMTPMIDMVFQLVAFFMIVTNFEQQQADERVQLPSDPLAAERPEAVKEDLVINIGFLRNPDGSKRDETAYVFVPGEEIPVMRYGQEKLPIERAVQISKGGEELLQKTTISIRADSDVPTGLIQELIKFSQENGFTKFALKAKQGDGDG